MSLKMLSEEAKTRAVGEVLAGLGTLSSVARRHGISIGYLSILVSRARKSIEPKSGAATGQSNSSETLQIKKLTARVQCLESKIDRIFK